jgi:hypothetical protein
VPSWPVKRVKPTPKTWSFTFRKEHWLGVSGNRVLRKVIGSNGEHGIGQWGRLHDEELHGLYSSPDIIRAIRLKMMRWVRRVARGGILSTCQGIFGLH